MKSKEVKKKFRCCTHCDTNYPEHIWIKNRGCLKCKWTQSDCPFDIGLVKTGDPFPCYIENRGKLLLNGKPAKLFEA